MAALDHCPSDHCFGCWWHHPRRGGHEAHIMDLRTGRRYCHECAAVLISWELDGCPDDPDLPYAEWINPELSAWQAGSDQ